MGWVMDHSPTTGTDRLVLLSVANHAGASPVDGAWESWPGTALLMREAGLRRVNTLHESLARLVERGHLERLVNSAPDSRMRPDRRTNLYRILLQNGVPCAGGACNWCGVPLRDERGPASRADGVPDPALTGSRETGPKPLVNRQEPSVEPLGAARRRRLPDPFVVTPRMQQWAGERWPLVDWRFETEQFTDHHRGKGSTQLDWEATWRTWIRNAGTRFAPRQPRPPVPSGQDAFEEYRRRRDA